MTEHDDRDDRDDRDDIDLDLGSLSDGARPSAEQWDTIASTAAHRRRRRSWALSAAAVLVLFAGTATILLSRSDDSVGFMSTDARDEPSYVIPPDDATEVSLMSYSPSYGVVYTESNAQWSLHGVSDDELRAAGQHPVPEVLAAVEATGIEPTRIGAFDAVYLACTGSLSQAFAPAASIPETTMVIDPEPGQLMALWSADGRLMTLLSTASQDCRSWEAEDSLTRGVEDLRVVDEAGFEQWQNGTDGRPPPTELRQGPYEEVPDTTSTPMENPPADPDGARAQIAVAIQRYADPYPDGTFPYLEDGVARAEEYRQRFATATQQAGSTSELGADNVQTLESVVFTSPEEANIQFSITASLPRGRYTFGQPGTAVVQDGRWVLSYDTLVRMLNRACVPPGGNDPSCKTGG